MKESAFILWPELEGQAAALLQLYRNNGLTIATAESCTGGLIAGVLTSIAGSSDVVDRGFVTYTNQAKMELVGVPAQLIDSHGAVSSEVAEAMARGTMERSPAAVSISVTGIAGPGGGNEAKPVGLVHFASMRRDGRLLLREERFGDLGRTQVRFHAVATALAMLESHAQGG